MRSGRICSESQNSANLLNGYEDVELFHDLGETGLGLAISCMPAMVIGAK